eukprot:1080583-Alexandrium_andersonii.AAC.1
MALSAARKLQSSENWSSPIMLIRAPVAPREARRLRRPLLERGNSDVCSLRVAERAVWQAGRAGTAT